MRGAPHGYLVQEMVHQHNQGMTTLPALIRRRLDLAGLDIPALEITGTQTGRS